MTFEPVWSLGLMSGTSMDGIDAAMLKTDGETIFAFGDGQEISWSEAARSAIAPVMKAPLDYRGKNAEKLKLAERAVEARHAKAVTDLLARSPQQAELIGFHGQTVYHAPNEGWTWQLGNGQRLADALNCPVVWDFRSNDMKAGGQGAPLASFYHFALAHYIGAAEPVCFLNIGGVANLTWIDPAKKFPEEDGALLSFDTGPGNALLNDFLLQKTGKPMDRNGAAAAKGVANSALIQKAASLAYFERLPPKSLDRNEFADCLQGVKTMSVEDGAATLTAITVETIRLSARHLPANPSRWLVCGGGRKNPVMMDMLKEALDAPVCPVEAVGLNGDLLEAQAFAFLAIRSQRGLPLSAPGTTGCQAPKTGGILSSPLETNPA